MHYPSIFNDVLAPVAQGPSSSNTAGPYRIGSVARVLLRGEPNFLKVEMSEKGGFFSTLYSMDSDKAFIAGILGKDFIGFDLSLAYQVAKEEGLDYEFVFSDKIVKEPSEMAILTVKSDLETLVLTGISLGGGEILISEINGEPCDIKGIRAEEVMVKGFDEPRRIPSVYPMSTLKDATPCFTTSVEMLKYAEENKLPLWQVAIDYEKSLTGMSDKEIWDKARQTLEISYESIDSGHTEDNFFQGVTVAKTREIDARMKDATLIPLGAADRGTIDALAIMEYSNSHGKIVCMPTGGAAGIIPASIKSTAESLGKTKDDEIKALLVAGLIGVFYYPTHYHGALGCQAEVGVATSMAAGALASMLTNDTETIESAAILAMQCIIGQVCDPIAGYVQIPCFIRNIASVPIAMTCANYALLGIDKGVNLDDMVSAVLRVGEKLRADRINDMGICMRQIQ